MADAEIIAVGSELLTPQKIDTNSLYLTDQLNALGVELVRKSVVGDDLARLTAAIQDALLHADIVVLTGGLGPTQDDLTRDGVAAALGRKLTFSEDILRFIEERFRRINRTMAETNRRQAYYIEGCEILENDRGTAPGLWVAHEDRVILLLPGPPHEMKAMFAKQCLPRLEKLLPPQVIRTRFFRVAGMGESDLDQLIAPVYMKYQNPTTTILAAAGDIQIHLRARSATTEEAERLLNEVAPPIQDLLGDRIYSDNGDTLEEVAGKLLRARHQTVCVAESATGGMLGQRLTSIPGSSDYFKGGFLTYTDEMKTKLVGVPSELIAEHTAVSEPVAKAMAIGARERTGADYALSITGYAGPDGNPPGLVYIGLSSPDSTEVRHIQFGADRDRVRALATNVALDLLRRKLLTTA